MKNDALKDTNSIELLTINLTKHSLLALEPAKSLDLFKAIQFSTTKLFTNYKNINRIVYS